jgi:hypothetical protein
MDVMQFHTLALLLVIVSLLLVVGKEELRVGTVTVQARRGEKQQRR